MGGLRRLGTMPADVLNMIASAQQAADTADAKAANARGMVLARDSRLAAVEQVAASLPVTLTQAEQAHAALGARIDSLQTALSAITGKTVTAQSKRVTTTQLLALGASIDLTATWPTPFPDANYVTIPLLDASTGVANVQGPFWKSQTKDAAVVTIRANIAVAAGLAVNVIGLRFG